MTTYYARDEAVLISGTYPATVIADYGRATVLVDYNTHCHWVQRERLSRPADHLAANEAPAPANAHYYGGIMQEWIEKRGRR